MTLNNIIYLLEEVREGKYWFVNNSLRKAINTILEEYRHLEIDKDILKSDLKEAKELSDKYKKEASFQSEKCTKLQRELNKVEELYRKEATKYTNLSKELDTANELIANLEHQNEMQNCDLESYREENENLKEEVKLKSQKICDFDKYISDAINTNNELEILKNNYDKVINENIALQKTNDDLKKISISLTKCEEIVEKVRRALGDT